MPERKHALLQDAVSLFLTVCALFLLLLNAKRRRVVSLRARAAQLSSQLKRGLAHLRGGEVLSPPVPAPSHSASNGSTGDWLLNLSGSFSDF